MQVVETNGTPGFEFITPEFKIVAGEEFEAGDGRLIGRHVFAVEIEEVDHPNVDLADFTGIVVDEGDDALAVGGIEEKFLVHFAFHSGEIGILFHGGLRRILRIDMPADAKRALVRETLLPALPSAHIVKEPSIAVEKRIGNDLLVPRVLLRVITGEEVVVLRIEKGGKVTVYLRREPLKGPDGVKKRTGYDKNTFVGPAHGMVGKKRKPANSVAAGRAGARRVWSNGIFP
jgi:hypothetical protein